MSMKISRKRAVLEKHKNQNTRTKLIRRVDKIKYNRFIDVCVKILLINKTLNVLRVL